MEEKEDKWVFLYWDEPFSDKKKEDDKEENKDDVH
jgi:hypothetical protein